MTGDLLPDAATGLCRVLAVAIVFLIGMLSYLSGSTPEWVVLKTSVGLVAVGLIAWLVTTVLGAGTADSTEVKGRNLDVTLPKAPPTENVEDGEAAVGSTTR